MLRRLLGEREWLVDLTVGALFAVAFGLFVAALVMLAVGSLIMGGVWLIGAEWTGDGPAAAAGVTVIIGLLAFVAGVLNALQD